MAQVALAKNCGNCGTLVTCGGNLTDVEFYGSCPCCTQSVAIANPNAPAVASGATIGGVSIHGACCKCTDEDKAQMPTSSPAEEPAVEAVHEEPQFKAPEVAEPTDDDLPYHGDPGAIS